MMELTLIAIREINGWFGEEDFNIIKEQAKILADIFDKKNTEVCSDCKSNFNYSNDHYVYQIIGGKRTRVYQQNKIRVRDNGCCGGCASSGSGNGGHFRYPSQDDPYFIHIKLQKIKDLYKFDLKTGFFNLVKKTCTLPRELRSYTCLNHTCEELKITSDERKKIYTALRFLTCLRKDLKLPI